MADPRKDLASAYGLLDDPISLMRKILEEELLRTKPYVVKDYPIICKDCGRKRVYDIPVDIPDSASRIKTLAALADQLQGRPAETQKVEVNIGVRRVEELEGLSNLELAQIAGTVIDAEYSEVDPGGS